ncbi:MAG: CRISPR-associated endonuclease Cas3'', partial [Gammaproteobacteria bacterium]|nr:CRISPR-associated endonuclease Cas3'' [Gammaproteobacteria bacterium]
MPPGWLPLADHMTDVACCFAALCRCSCIGRALAVAAGRSLDDQDIARLSVLAFLHDLGKASSGFQAKRWPTGQRPPCWPTPSGHGAQALYLLQGDNSVDHLLNVLPLEELASWGAEAVLPLLTASISHHGRPLIEDIQTLGRVSRRDWQPVIYPAGRMHYDPLPVLEEISLKARRLFPTAFELVTRPLPDNPPFANLFAGLVQFA